MSIVRRRISAIKCCNLGLCGAVKMEKFEIDSFYNFFGIFEGWFSTVSMPPFANTSAEYFCLQMLVNIPFYEWCLHYTKKTRT